MKKLRIYIFVIFILFFSATSSVVADTAQQKYESALRQLIVVLEKKVESLKLQLQQFIDSQKQSSPQSLQIKPVDEPITNSSTSLEIKVNTDYVIYGGNCSSIQIYPKVLDQNGTVIPNSLVTLINPETYQEVSKIISDTDQSISFIPQQLSGYTTVTVRTGDIATSTTINLQSMHNYLYNPDGTFIPNRSNPTEDKSILSLVLSGQKFDINTNMCK